MSFPYTFTEQELAWFQAISLLIAILAFFLSVLAVYFTARTYWQKKGAFVRGSYNIITSSVATEDKFVSEVLLENLKDRSVVIFGIYLKLSHSYTVEIENFEENPLILKPFEVFRRSYDPIECYSFNARRVDLNALFDSRYRNRLVLSTTDGKLVVKKPIQKWMPVLDWFKNQLKITAHVHRLQHNGRSYGRNALFLVDLFKDDKLVETIALYPKQYTYKWFKDLGGEKSSLESKDTVRILFETAIVRGDIKAERVDVIDCEAARERQQDRLPLSDEPIVAAPHSWFFVNVVGRLATCKRDKALRRENMETARRNAERSKLASITRTDDQSEV